MAVLSIRQASKRDGALGPTDLGLVFPRGARLRPGVPGTPDPGSGTARPGSLGTSTPGGRGPGRRALRSGALQRGARVQGALRPGEGGRRRVECLYRDPAAAASPARLQASTERHLSIFRQTSWPLIAKFIWFKAALGEAGRENLSSVIGWPR